MHYPKPRRVEETKKKTGTRETSSGGNWGPRANPKSKPCACLVWTGATSSRQVSQTYQGFPRHLPGAFRGLPGVRGLRACGAFQGPLSVASHLKPRHQPPKLPGESSRSNSPPSRIMRLEETGGLEPNPKPNLLLVATGSRLDSL